MFAVLMFSEAYTTSTNCCISAEMVSRIGRSVSNPGSGGGLTNSCTAFIFVPVVLMVCKANSTGTNCGVSTKMVSRG
jgi:hypothetical protein